MTSLFKKSNMEPISAFFSSMAAKIGAMAAFGALAHTIHAKREGKTRSVGDFFLLWIMSSFFGVVLAMISASVFKENTWIVYGMAGTGGWLGIETTSFIKEWVQSKKPQL